MSRFLVTAGSESMNRRTGSRRGSVHIGVDQLAGLVTRAGHQVPVAGEGPRSSRAPWTPESLRLTPASISSDAKAWRHSWRVIGWSSSGSRPSRSASATSRSLAVAQARLARSLIVFGSNGPPPRSRLKTRSEAVAGPESTGLTWLWNADLALASGAEAASGPCGWKHPKPPLAGGFLFFAGPYTGAIDLWCVSRCALCGQMSDARDSACHALTKRGCSEQATELRRGSLRSERGVGP